MTAYLKPKPHPEVGAPSAERRLTYPDSPTMALTPKTLLSRRMLLALTLSLLLHAASIASLEWLGRDFKQAKPKPRIMLDAILLMQPRSEHELQQPAEPMLKNTLAPAEPETAPAAPTAQLQEQKTESTPLRGATKANAQRKLAEHVYYPPEAVAQGIQGEVRLLVALDRKGKVVHAKVIVSSGHAVLDQAAVSAAYAIGRLPGADALDLMLPVIFKLE